LLESLKDILRFEQIDKRFLEGIRGKETDNSIRNRCADVHESTAAIFELGRRERVRARGRREIERNKGWREKDGRRKRDSERKKNDT
jgi:hypothetical protein